MVFEHQGRKGSAALVNAVAAPLGLALGAAGASTSVQMLPAPTRLCYLVVAIAVAILAMSLLFAPGSGTTVPGPPPPLSLPSPPPSTGVVVGSPAAYFMGTIAAGVGFGAGYYAALRAILPLSAPEERTGLLSTIYIICYLSFSLPAVAAGLLVGGMGLRATTLGYGTLLVAASLPALIIVLRRSRGTTPAGAPPITNRTSNKENTMSETPTLKQRLVGAWRLQSYLDVPVDGSAPLHPMGTDAQGIIMYTPDGFMSAQLMISGRPDFASGDWFDGTDEEYRAEANDYIAYSGPYAVNEEEKSLTHTMDVSLFPNWEGQTQPRIVELKEDILRLSTAEPFLSKGQLVNSYLTWRRA